MVKNNCYIIIWSLIVIGLIITCTPGYDEEEGSDTPSPLKNPINIIIFSDPHLYNKELGLEGDAFNDFSARSEELVEESEALLETMTNTICKSDAQIVLIPGDLTRNGARQAHLKMTTYLARMEQAGKKVFVIPGEYDLDNPDAYSYTIDGTTDTDIIDARDFKTIYGNYGYLEARDVDSPSLSYLVEPVPGLWVIAIDSYDEHEEIPAGAIETETLLWIENILNEAKRTNKVVIAFMHHGLLPHYSLQHSQFKGSIIDNYEYIASRLSKSGLRVVFTGQYHAQDVVMYRETSRTPRIFDVETGSLTVYPCPYREITITPQLLLAVNSHEIRDIHFPDLTTDFPGHAENKLKKVLNNRMVMVISQITGKSLADAKKDLDNAVGVVGGHPMDIISEGVIAHYKGDEQISAEAFLAISYLTGFQVHNTDFWGEMIHSIYTDLPPGDKALTIDLRTGRVSDQ